jgi:CDP-paratose 2-epimerase
MNILITGGAGFIGTNTACYFGGKKENSITIIDNLTRVGTDANLLYLKKNITSPLTFIQDDIKNIKSHVSEIKKTDVIIHLAGQTAVTTSLSDPQNDFSSNVVGGFSLLEAIRIHNPKVCVLYASTNKVYGDLKHHIRSSHPEGVTEDERLEFISPYGCSKGTIDQYMQDYYRSFGIKTVVFRQSCIYGPHQMGVEDQGWIAHFSKQVLQKKPITIFGDGNQIRDLLYIEDLIYAYDLAIQKIDTVGGHVFNIGGGKNNSYSLQQVLSILKDKTDISPELKYAKERLGDQSYFVSDNSKAKKMLNWQPTTSFTTGISSLITWQQQNLV